MHGLSEWGISHGYLGLFVVLAVGVVVPLPEDTTLLFAGCLVSSGKLTAFPTWLAATLGCMTGITVSYSIGRVAGLQVVNRFGHYVGITPERLEKTTDWFHRVGKWGLALGYFVPGVRHLTALIAGSSKVGYPIFILFAGAGSLIWSSFFLAMGYFLKDRWKQFGAGFKEHRMEVVTGVLVIMAVFLVWDWRRLRKARLLEGVDSGSSPE